ncbi:MAG: hypothetical protein H8F28_18950 [Fibrella sp.]|nr:hypothetical protein [Armatimonadota bacterium]
MDQAMDDILRYVERIYEAERNPMTAFWSGEDTSGLVQAWVTPEDDGIVDFLTDLFRRPPAHVESDDLATWEEVVSNLLSKSVGSNERRIKMLHAGLTDPELRRLATMSLNHLSGDAKISLVEDLITRVPEMSEEEIDYVIEDVLYHAPDGHRRVLELLHGAPASYRPYPAYLFGRLPIHAEVEQGRVRYESDVRSPGSF